MKSGRLFAEGRLIAMHTRRAEGPFERARGLLARPPLQPGEALLLDPCSGIHTCGMRYPIDAVFLDRQGKVLEVAADVSPWRFAIGSGRAVVELAAGEAQRLGITAGMPIEWRDGTGETE